MKRLYNFFLATTLIIFFSADAALLACGRINFTVFLVIIGFFIFAAFYLRRFYRRLCRNMDNDIETFQEKINLLEVSLSDKKKLLSALPQKSEKISFLFDISHQATALIDFEEIFDFAVAEATELFPRADDVLLFMLQGKIDSLTLVRSKKKKGIVIKEKKGDIVDIWAVRNNQSLFVDDLGSDFRFDYNKVVGYRDRGIRSLVSSPLAIGDKVFGVLRVESAEVAAFNSEDFRIFRSLCDISAVVLERAGLFRDIEELAIMDSLTGLFLRDYFFTRLKEEAIRAVKNKTNLGLIMIDIDNFKKINDVYGHAVGDIVLKRAAKIMQQVTGDSGNLACRFGGEEFITFLVECDKDSLLGKAEELRAAIETSKVVFRRKQVSFTISAGVVMLPADSLNVLDLLDKVDHLLYEAKRQGKNRVCTNL
jgi:diguanylate cyclase (GGDEF)-like protein